MLLEGGINPNCEGALLVWAILRSADDTSNWEIIDLLLQHGIAIGQFNQDGYTPLIAAAEVGDIDICQCLLGRGANINALTVRGNNPLTVAAMHGHVEIVKLLLSSGASGRPPPLYSGKWKHLRFDSEVSWPTRQEILSILCENKYL
jgi:ankyrin repeat protein